MTIHTRPAEPIADCALSHHVPGRVVSYSEFDGELGRSVIRCATVLEHRAGVRCILLRREDGRQRWMSCGPVAPWGNQ
jgi:hypothetical protein